MAKPIFIVKVPADTPLDNVNRTKSVVIESVNNEYHVLVVACINPTTENPVQFECYNAERMPEISIEKIKEIVK